MEKGPQSLGLVLAASPPTHHKEHFGQGDPGRGKPRQGCSCQQAITCDSMSPSAFFHVRLPAERPEPFLLLMKASKKTMSKERPNMQGDTALA